MGIQVLGHAAFSNSYSGSDELNLAEDHLDSYTHDRGNSRFPIPRAFQDPSPPITLLHYGNFTNETLPYTELAPLYVACLINTATYVNKERRKVIMSAGLFACSDDDSNPKTFLSVKAVAQAPPVTGRMMYSYLITVLRGFNAWAKAEGKLMAGVYLATLEETNPAGLVFVMEMGRPFRPLGLVLGGHKGSVALTNLV